MGWGGGQERDREREGERDKARERQRVMEKDKAREIEMEMDKERENFTILHFFFINTVHTNLYRSVFSPNKNRTKLKKKCFLSVLYEKRILIKTLKHYKIKRQLVGEFRIFFQY